MSAPNHEIRNPKPEIHNPRSKIQDPKSKTRSPLVPDLPDGQSIKLIGLGGVGGIVGRYGATFLAPLAKGRSARLVLIDGDAFEPGNATRMVFSDCGNKAAVTLGDLRPRFVDSGLELSAVPEYVTSQNLERLIHRGDIVLLCVDNHATRKLVSDFCGTLDEVLLISGGNDGIGEDVSGRFHQGTYGNCQVYLRRHGRDLSPSLTRYHREIENPTDELPTEVDCITAATSVPQLLLANLATASSILNALWLCLSGAIHYSELALDIGMGQMKPLSLPAPQLDEPADQPSHAPVRPR